MNSKNNNTALIVIAVIAAFGLVMATAYSFAVINAFAQTTCKPSSTPPAGGPAFGHQQQACGQSHQP
jgi:hypothetical protein